MNNEGGKMEEDLRSGFGETEKSFEISEETARKLGETTEKAVDVDKLIEQTDADIRQKIKEDDLNAAYNQLEDGREAVQEVEDNK
ncbi:MAG: hypothetical protein Q4A25_03280 [Candidatus Saccharibacteria bacterium]|nr:hypothetical protein [Candidatus Saccharibacteria bacterium]